MNSDHKPDFLDLKLPLGGLLTFYGVVLTLYGIFTKPEFYQKSLGINVNIIMGLLMLVFGLGMLFFARKKKKA